MNYLSKSDFKAARECPTKLYYRKNKYPNLKQEDDFLHLLSEGGFMVGKMAQLLFPKGIEIPGGRDPEAAIAQTQKYLEQDDVVLFEPAIYVEGMLVRVDVLIKHGKQFELIEVKAKSFDGEIYEKHIAGGIECFWKKREHDLDTHWRPYLEDAAYQTYVLQRAYPDSKIHPFLMLCDKSKQTQIDNLLQQFILHANQDSKGNNICKVEFTGDIEALRQDHLLIKVPVQPEVKYLLPEIKEAADEFLASVIQGPLKIQTPLSTECKHCEYRLPLNHQEKNGFLECWGELGKVSPHLLDLCHLGNVKQSGEKIGDILFAKGKASFDDVPLEWLSSPKHGTWQKRQIAYANRRDEWLSPDLKSVLQQHKYPLHFIDFETSRMAFPYHIRMRPYGLVAFQWSSHTLRAPGLPPEHRDWINLSDVYPNVEFAQTLMDCLGREGTIFMWAHHERSVLKDIAKYVEEGNLGDAELSDWLQWMDLILTDQCTIAREHYYQADMQGSVSIKNVLPAVWNNNSYLHQVEYLKPYFKARDGRVVNPYDTLEKIDIAEQAEVIKEGTGAMRAYQEMMYGLHRGDSKAHEKWTQLLRQYCALDTMAMVIIYKHWCVKVGMEV